MKLIFLIVLTCAYAKEIGISVSNSTENEGEKRYLEGGGGGGGGGGSGSNCGAICAHDGQCFGSCPYCKRLSVSEYRCRPDMCSQFCVASWECEGKCNRCHWAKCKDVQSGCFPGDSIVIQESGDLTRMKDLRIGNSIKTLKDGFLISTPVLGFLDKRIGSKTDYLVMKLADGRRISISVRHVMFIAGEEDKLRSVLAMEVNIGDKVFIQEAQILVMSQIVDITMEQKTGAYVPLTAEGTMLVDGVLVSCYTNTNHWLAHSVLAPLRWAPDLLLDSEMSQDEEGIRTIPSIIREVGNLLGLVTMTVTKEEGTSNLNQIGYGIGNGMDTCTIKF